MVATNSLGWCVEYYQEDRGWFQYSPTFSSKEEAACELDLIERCRREAGCDLSIPYRVYEVLS